MKEDLEDSKIKIGDIILKEHKDQNIYYIFYKENEWDNVEYDQLFDIYKNLKFKLQNNKKVKANIPSIEIQYNNASFKNLNDVEIYF